MPDEHAQPHGLWLWLPSHLKVVRIVARMDHGGRDINDIVRACSIDTQLFAGNDQLEIAAALYYRIFKFLEKAMLWFTKSRAKGFINFFKENFYEELESDSIEICRLSNNIM